MSWLSTRPVHLALAQAGTTPSALASPGWLDLASTGSIWLPLAPLLGRSGIEWLDLAAPGFLAGSIWLLCMLLGLPTGSIWLPNECPINMINNKKIDSLIDDPASMLPDSSL